MRRHLAVLVGSVALGLCGLIVFVSVRPGNASAPPVVAGAKAEGDGPRIASSKITHVTVYPDSALVTREIDVPAGAGLMELVVSPLPEATIVSSLYTESNETIRVLTTRFRTRPVKEDTRDEVRKIDEEIKKLQLEQRKITAESKTLSENMGLMTKLEAYTTASTIHATEKGKLDSDAAIQLAKYLMDGRVEKMKALLVLQEQTLTNTESMEYAKRRLNSLTTGTNKVERDAVLVIDKPNPGAGKVKLNYLVSSAAWKPQYKFRAGKTAKDAVTVEYLAAVVQQTGEDWERVGITLSTAQPMLNAAPPELHALAVAIMPRDGKPTGVTLGGLQQGVGNSYLNNDSRVAQTANVPPGAMQPPMPSESLSKNRITFANPGMGARAEDLKEASKQLRAQSQIASNMKASKDASELANYAAVLDQVCDLVVMTQKASPGAAPKSAEGPSVTYHLANKLSVPSRNDEQVIEVTKLDFEPDYFYKAVPVLSAHVYRQANLVNKSKHVLLPGEATMYNGTDFVGRMTLPLVAVGEEFTAGFGAEPQLQVSRLMVERSKTMQAGNQILKYEYRILISSYKTEKVKVQVWDRLPHAEKEAMGVNLVKVSPELCKDPVYLREERTNNLLRWDLEIDPEMRGEKAKKITYDFQLELDRQATLGSFQTK